MIRLGALLIFMAVLVPPGPARAADPDALWKIVGSQCVPDEAQNGKPDPCVSVDPAKGWAVLKDNRGITEYLLIPTARVTGMEDKVLLDPHAPDYFAAAWEARRFTEAGLNKQLPRQDIALAVNSRHARSQNQLHIHVDCVREDVRDALAAHKGEIGESWSPFPVPLAGHDYQARRVMGDTLAGADPFLLLADGVAGARADMGAETLAAVGMVFEGGQPGFVLLADHANDAVGDRAGSSQLLDHACAVTKDLP